MSLRKLLGFKEELIDHTKGPLRSVKAKLMYANAVDYETEFYKYLITKLPEVRVHEHKILRPGHVCCDFFIYTSNNNGYAIDIFYAQDLFTLQRIIRIKYLRYSEIKFKVYFVVVGNNSIKQGEIDLLLKNRKIKLPDHIVVTTESDFKNMNIIAL